MSFFIFGCSLADKGNPPYMLKAINFYNGKLRPDRVYPSKQATFPYSIEEACLAS